MTVFDFYYLFKKLKVTCIVDNIKKISKKITNMNNEPQQTCVFLIISLFISILFAFMQPNLSRSIISLGCEQYYEVNSVRYNLGCNDIQFYKLWDLGTVDYVNGSLIRSSVIYARKAAIARAAKNKYELNSIFNRSITVMEANTTIENIKNKHGEFIRKYSNEIYVHTTTNPIVPKETNEKNVLDRYYDDLLRKVINEFNSKVLMARNEIVKNLNSMELRSKMTPEEIIKKSLHCYKGDKIHINMEIKVKNAYEKYDEQVAKRLYYDFRKYVRDSGYHEDSYFANKYGIGYNEFMIETTLCNEYDFMQLEQPSIHITHPEYDPDSNLEFLQIYPVGIPSVIIDKKNEINMPKLF